MATLQARRSPSRAQGKDTEHQTRRHSSSPPARSSSSQTADSCTKLSLRPSATPRTASAGQARQLLGDHLTCQVSHWRSVNRQAWLQDARSQPNQLLRTQSCQPPAEVYEEEAVLSKARTLSGVLLPAQIAGTAAAVLIDASFRQSSNAESISSVNGYSPPYGAAATAATAAAVGTATAACTLASTETCGMSSLLSTTTQKQAFKQANHMIDLENSGSKLPVYVATSPFEASANKTAMQHDLVSSPNMGSEDTSAMAGIHLCSFCGQERPCKPPCPLAVTTAALQFTGIYAKGRFRVACFIGNKSPRNSTSPQTSPDASPTVSSAANQSSLVLNNVVGNDWNHQCVQANQQSTAGHQAFDVNKGAATSPVKGATDLDVPKLNTLLALSDGAKSEVPQASPAAAPSIPQCVTPHSHKRGMSARIQRKGRFVVVEYDDVVSAAKAAALAALNSAGDEDGGVAAASAAAAASLHDAASAALAAENGCCTLHQHTNKSPSQLSASTALTATAAAAAALSAPLESIPACASTAAATAAVLEHTAQVCAQHALESSTLTIAHSAIAAVVQEQLHAVAALCGSGSTTPFDAVLSQAPVLSALGLPAATSQASSSNATSPCMSSVVSVSDSSAALSCLSDATTLDTVIRSVAEAVVPHAKTSNGIAVWSDVAKGAATPTQLPGSGCGTPVHSPVSMSRTSSMMMNDVSTSSPKIQLPASRQPSSVSSRGPASCSSAVQTPRAYRRGRFSIQEIGPDTMTSSNSFCAASGIEPGEKAELAHLKSISSSGAIDSEVSVSAGVADVTPSQHKAESRKHMSPYVIDAPPSMYESDRGDSFCRGSSFAYLCRKDQHTEDDEHPSIPNASFACWISDCNDGCGSGCGSQHGVAGNPAVDVQELMSMRKHANYREETSDASYAADATSKYEGTQQNHRKVTDQLNIFITAPVPPQKDGVCISSGYEIASTTTASQQKSMVPTVSSNGNLESCRTPVEQQDLGLSQVKQQQQGSSTVPAGILPVLSGTRSQCQLAALPPISTTNLSCTPNQKTRKVGRFTVVEGH